MTVVFVEYIQNKKKIDKIQKNIFTERIRRQFLKLATNCKSNMNQLQYQKGY